MGIYIFLYLLSAILGFVILGLPLMFVLKHKQVRSYWPYIVFGALAGSIIPLLFDLVSLSVYHNYQLGKVILVNNEMLTPAGYWYVIRHSFIWCIPGIIGGWLMRNSIQFK